ncbi:hypothetical protein AYO44_10675 [Planctomycetaceae bacterium SCGC AG-212-F19]|nr:hypothetical protein AYO44_10675 [Planctomycetaceae bacterium SCGC AG-212-F19]
MHAGSEFDLLIVGGYGHVGLPLGIVFANAGLNVALYDIDAAKGQTIAQGNMPFLEYDAEPILQRVLGRTLHLVERLEAVAAADALIITVGTPVDEYLNPKLMPIIKLAGDLKPHLRPDHLVVLRSTVFPGTTRRLGEFLHHEGCVAHLAFCPERIVQGYAIRELRSLPQIVSGLTPAAAARAHALFVRLQVETLEVTVEEAELAKLFANAWRYIQFAAANQFYMIATEAGADFQRIHHAMTHGYKRASDFPKAGFAAGPCLLKDTVQLSAFHRNNFMLGHAAMLVNEGLPSFLVRQLAATHPLQGTTVGILGMAFKKDVDDIRDSLSYKLGKLLRFHGADVLYSDEFAQDPDFVGKEELLERSAIAIVGAPHTAYRSLCIPDHIHLVDIWNVIPQRVAGAHAA